VRQLVREKGLLTEQELNEVLDLRAMTELGVPEAVDLASPQPWKGRICARIRQDPGAAIESDSRRRIF
jgi:hypothetical protein